MTSTFFSKVSFVNKISDIMKATSDDDKPIPGYLYQEICNITLETTESCESCLEFLVSRLDRDSTHVKLKVLKLMKYLVEKGHPNFRLGLLKNSNGIKSATKYSGPPDPLHGNVPYVMVRKTAQSLSEVLFNTENSTPSEQIKPVCTDGMGSGSYAQHSQNRASRMEGFGNTPTHTRTIGENIRDGLFKMAEKLGETSADHQREVLSALEDTTTSNYTPPPNTVSHHVPPSVKEPTSTTQSRTVEPPRRHVPGKAGGGWEDSEEEEEAGDRPLESSGSGVGSQETGDSRLIPLEAESEDTRPEQQVISSYVEKNDGPYLSHANLAAFLQECAALNCDKVVELLNDRIKSSTSSESLTGLLRSLLLLETLMVSDLVSLERLASVCRDGFVTVVHTHTGPCQNKARKLIRILEKLTNHQNILPLMPEG